MAFSPMRFALFASFVLPSAVALALTSHLSVDQEENMGIMERKDTGEVPDGKCPGQYAQAQAAHGVDDDAPWKLSGDDDTVKEETQQLIQNVAPFTYYEGSVFAFAQLASMTYCGGKGAALLKDSQYECKLCQKAGFKISSPSLTVAQNSSTVIYMSQIVPVSDSAELDHIDMSEGCLVSIRGSQEINDWLHNFQAWQKTIDVPGCESCLVHGGFWDLWNNIEPQVTAALKGLGCDAGSGKKLYFTGHSLGGALATLGSYLSAHKGYDIGAVISFQAPRVGNVDFQQQFDSTFQDITSYRVVYGRDPVVHAPPQEMNYVHVNTQIFYDSGTLDARVCLDTEDSTCANKYVDVATLGTSHEHCAVTYISGCNMCNQCTHPDFH